MIMVNTTNVNKRTGLKTLLIAGIVVIGLISWFLYQLTHLNQNITDITESINYSQNNLSLSQKKPNTIPAVKDSLYQIVYSDEQVLLFLDKITRYYQLSLKERSDSQVYQVNGQFYFVMQFMKYILAIPQNQRAQIIFKALEIKQDQAQLIITINKG